MSNKKVKAFGILGITLCGLCCALPIIGAAIGMASITAISFYLEKVGIVMIGLAGFFIWYAWYSKRRKAKAACVNNCTTDCACKADAATSK